MAFLPADIARCVATYNMPNGVQAQSRYTGAWNGTVNREFADAVDDWEAYLTTIFNEIHPEVADVVTAGGAVLYKVNVIGGEEVLEFAGLVPMTPGPSNTNEMLPHGVCGLISADLDGLGRGSAKKFFPGFTEAAADNGIWIAATQTRLANAATAWGARFGPGDDWIPGTWSIPKGFRSFVQIRGRAEPAYQRRRKPGVGI
jgi:hypothetical protein